MISIASTKGQAALRFGGGGGGGGSPRRERRPRGAGGDDRAGWHFPMPLYEGLTVNAC
jgi:hypothetical protein